MAGVPGKLFRDLRFGVRSISRARTFTPVAVLIFGLGVGTNIVAFTLLNALFFTEPPAVTEPHRLVSMHRRMSNTGVVWASMGYPEYEFYRDNGEVFSGLAAYNSGGMDLVVGTSDGIVQADSWWVSENFFQVLGVPLTLGGGFREDGPHGLTIEKAVVLSHSFCLRHFGGDPEAVGRALQLNGEQFQVVGVLTGEFRGLDPTEPAPDIFLPIGMRQTLVPGGDPARLVLVDSSSVNWLRVVGRLAPEVEFSTARSAVPILQERWLSASHDWVATVNWAGTYDVVLSDRYSLSPNTSNELNRILKLVFLSTGLTLLIACANVAVLMLARASTRQEEIGVRAALGAGRGGVVRQLLSESFLIAMAGGAVGLMLAYWVTGIAAAIFPQSFAVDFKPDLWVVAFAVLLSGVAGIVAGLAPALFLFRSDLSALLMRRLQGQRSGFAHHALVVTQIALSLVLVTEAGLFIRSLRSAQALDPGFQPEDRILLEIDLSNHHYTEEEGVEFTRTVLAGLQRIPGVVSVSTAHVPPFGGNRTSPFKARGTAFAEQEFRSGFNWVGPGYFRAMGIPLVEGRDFTRYDDGRSFSVAIVNETTARRVWPGRSAIGQTIEWAGVPITVVGVAKDATYNSLGEEGSPQTYLLQNYIQSMTFVIAAETDPYTLVGPITMVLRSAEPNLAISRIRTLEEVLESQWGSYRDMAVLCSLLGGLALFLAAVGLFGVQSFYVSCRSREFGLRMALGAKIRQVAAMVLGRGAVLGLLGIAIGMAVALGLGRVISALLFNVRPHDPLNLLIASAVLMGMVGAASLLPALRAGRMDPMEVLRKE